MGIWDTVLITFAGVILGAVLSWLIQRYSEYHLLRRLKDTVKDRQHVSLSEEFLLTRVLAKKIRSDGFEPRVIFAVVPGGAMVAEWLSRRFLGTYKEPIPLLNIWVDTRRTKGPGYDVDEATVCDEIQTITAKLSTVSPVLLVTDICRSGNTLRAACKYLKRYVPDENIRTAALLRHTTSPVHPTYVTDETPKTVLFDWKAASITD